MELLPAPWLLCFSLILFSYFLINTKYSRRKARLPPGPLALPVIGSVLSLDGQPHHAFTRLAKLYGPIITIKIGMSTTVIVSTPETAKQVLQKQDIKLSGRWIPNAIQIDGLPAVSMVWNPTNQFWRQLRSMCNTNLFSHKSLENSKHLRSEIVVKLVNFFRENAGRPAEFGRVAFGAVLSLISITLFSVDLNSGSETSQEFKELVATIVDEGSRANISDFFPVLRVFDLQGRRKSFAGHLKKLLVIINDIIDQRVKSKIAGKEETGDFLDFLLQQQTEDKMDRKTMMTLLLDMFAGGVESTSITLEWTMAELLKNPNILSKAKAEVDKAMGSRDKAMEESDVDKLPYLQAVVKEGLRIHPSGPFLIPHMATEDVELDKYLVPKGTRVLVNIWAISRDEQVWPEPNSFKPERFLQREVDMRSKDFDLIPFGAGRRICPGMPLAMRMLHLALGSLLHSFDWRLPHGVEPKDVDLKEKFAATLTLETPLQVVAIPRT